MLPFARAACAVLLAAACGTTARAQGVLPVAPLLEPVQGMTLPQPVAANTIADPEDPEKRCYDEALTSAWKAGNRGLQASDDFFLLGMLNVWDEALKTLDPAQRAATLSALTGTASRDAFLAALPEDLDGDQMDALREARNKMDEKGIFLQEARGDCKPATRIALESGNPNDPRAAPGYHLVGRIQYDCACGEDAPLPIKGYAIDFVVPVELDYAGGDVGTGIALSGQPAQTLWYVQRLACCRKDREEEEALTGEPLPPAGEAPRSGGGDGCTGNVPFEGLTLTGVGGYSGSRPFPDQTYATSCVGVRAGYPVANSAMAGLHVLHTREREAINQDFADQVDRDCFTELDAFFDWYFGCHGPVQPFVGVQAGAGLGRRRYRYEDGFTGSFENRDVLSGWNAGITYGIQANAKGAWSAGLRWPLVEYRRLGSKPADSDQDPTGQGQFRHALNQWAPSFSLTYDLGAAESGNRTRYYDDRPGGFDPTAGGLVGCGDLGWNLSTGEGFRNGGVSAGAGVMVPFGGRFLAGGGLDLDYWRSRTVLDLPGVGEETYAFRRFGAGLNAELQAYPLDCGGPVDPMVGVHAYAGMGLLRDTSPFTGTSGNDIRYGAGLQAGLYFDVAENWGLLGTFPLAGYGHVASKDEGDAERSGSGSWTWGVNKPVVGVEVLYRLGGGDGGGF